MIRRFLPVGQGAFCCEKFTEEECCREVNVVYDCGSLSGKVYLKNAIDRSFNDGEEVDVLFISHLDDDHVNGLQMLLAKCRVRQICFPLMTRGDIILQETAWRMRDGKVDDLMLRLLRHPAESIMRMAENAVAPTISGTKNRSVTRPQLLAVKPIDSAEYSDFDELWGAGGYGEYAQGGFDSIASSGENIWLRLLRDKEEYISDRFRIKPFEWRYIPHNFRASKRVIRLMKALHKRGIGPRELEHSFDNDKVLAKVKAAYQEVPGPLNVNSMTVYSGPASENADGWATSPGCLYTGDYDASGKSRWGSLFKAYEQYWRTMGCIQLPHHGSRHNYNTRLAEAVENPEAMFVVSAGTQNQFKHPHRSVIMDLLSKGRNLRVVTEKPQSEVVMEIVQQGV